MVQFEFVILRMFYQTQVKYLCINQFKVLQVKGVLSDPELHGIVLKAGFYTLRLIGPISYLGECDLMVHPEKYSFIFYQMHFVLINRSV